MYCRHERPCRRGFLSKRPPFALVFVAVVFLALYTLPSFTNAKKHSPKRKARCKNQTSEWSDCSKACGIGLTTKVKTAKRCRLKRELSLCITRPCSQDFFNFKMKRGKKRCLPHFKPKRKETLIYAGAKSVRKYKMRYCGWCTNINKCCTPVMTKIRKIVFERPNGKRFFKKMSFIKKCSCHRNCPARESSVVYTYRLHGDMHRGRTDNKNEFPDDKRSAAPLS